MPTYRIDGPDGPEDVHLLRAEAEPGEATNGMDEIRERNEIAAYRQRHAWAEPLLNWALWIGAVLALVALFAWCQRHL